LPEPLLLFGQEQPYSLRKCVEQWKRLNIDQSTAAEQTRTPPPASSPSPSSPSSPAASPTGAPPPLPRDSGEPDGRCQASSTPRHTPRPRRRRAAEAARRRRSSLPLRTGAEHHAAERSSMPLLLAAQTLLCCERCLARARPPPRRLSARLRLPSAKPSPRSAPLMAAAHHNPIEHPSSISLLPSVRSALLSLWSFSLSSLSLWSLSGLSRSWTSC